MYNDLDETRKVLNEACVEIAERATTLLFEALEKNSIFHTSNPSSPPFSVVCCLRLKQDQENVFFELYKKATQTLAPLFYNNPSPTMIKDSIMVFWKRSDTRHSNVLMETLKGHHNFLMGSNNKTEEAEFYRQTKSCLDKYLSASRDSNMRDGGNLKDQGKVNQLRSNLFDRMEASTLPLEVVIEGFHGRLEKMGKKVQEISDIQTSFMEFSISPKEQTNESAATLVLSKRERHQGMG